jgi:hypothetical protein
VHKEVPFEIEFKGTGAGFPGDVIAAFIRPFDLGKAPLFRAGLIELSPDEHLLMLDMHHIIKDGTSAGVFINEFADLYEGMELPELRIQYKDFTVWQSDLLRSDAVKRQEQYWEGVFQGEIPVLNIPIDYPRPPIQSFEGDYMIFDLGRKLSGKIKEMARRNDVTLYTLLLAMYYILLSKSSGDEDIVVGTPVEGRSHVDLKNLIGMFVNTLVLRNYPKGEKSFRQFLEEVKYNTLNAFENQDYQFESLIDKLGIKRHSGKNILFDAMFALANPGLGIPELKKTGLIIKPYKFENKTSPFDLVLYAFETDVIAFKLLYSTKLFKKETMERFTGYFKEIAAMVEENQEIQLKDIRISHGLMVQQLNAIQEEEGDFAF